MKYNDLNKLIDKRCSEAKEMWLHQKCEDIDRMAKLHQAGAIYKKVKEVTGKEKILGGMGGIKDKQGNILFEKEDIKKKWA